MLARMWRKGNPFALLVGMQTGAATLENIWRFLKKLKIELPYDPAIALLSSYPKDTKVQFQRQCMYPKVHSSTINNSQTMKRAQMSINWWMDKEEVVYIYIMEYYLAIKKNEILPFATMWMELECIVLSKISQSEKDKYHMTSLMWNLRNKTDEHRGREGKTR